MRHASTGLLGEAVKVGTLAQEEHAKWEEVVRQRVTSSVTNPRYSGEKETR